MSNNNRCRIMSQAGLHHFPWMDFGVADGAFEQRFVRNQPMLVIQQQQNKCKRRLSTVWQILIFLRG